MWLYRSVLFFLTPYLLLKVWRFRKSYENYRSREVFGFGETIEADLWIHCASVGEVLALRPLVEKWHGKHPNNILLITTMTPTGATQVGKSFPFAIHRYLPMDLRCCVKRAFKRIKCSHLVIIEMELWPNFLQEAKAKGMTVDIVNARLSERSFQKYQTFSLLSHPLMQLPDRFFAHAKADAERFEKLGARNVQVMGSIKFDLSVPEDVHLKDWRSKIKTVFVWAGASTHDGEEELLLKAHKRLKEQYPQALLLIVPRHPERFEQVYELALRYFPKVTKRSQNEPALWANYDVVIGDSMGEMMYYYQASDLAFVGGSFIERGGHNPIEPAILAKAILVGPHTFNFSDITQQLVDEEGALRCASLEALESHLLKMAHDTEYRVRTGNAALAFARSNQGAVDRVLTEIDFH